MNRRDFLRTSAILAAALNLPGAARAAETETIDLPEPERSGGMPLMRALNERRSDRNFSAEDLDGQTLSNLLWAAWGVNRPSGKRTAPSASNRRETTVYCAMKTGCYRYEAGAHRLVRITDGDLRAMTGKQDFTDEAPLNLVFVADLDKQGSEFYAACDTGFISQNVYLYCASAGLNTVVRGWIDRDPLHEAMGLDENMWITLCQTVGKPG
jgi:SagB-type dehydrogenase family enzyme